LFAIAVGDPSFDWKLNLKFDIFFSNNIQLRFRDAVKQLNKNLVLIHCRFFFSQHLSFQALIDAIAVGFKLCRCGGRAE
jgi:hypothetical protein